jgi:hypothetical protein
MSKAVCMGVAISLALSGAAFAKGTSHSKSSARSAEAATSTQITAADCQTLTVESARAACLRSAQGHTGAAIGATSGAGTGMGQGPDHAQPAVTPAQPNESTSAGGEAAR